MKSTARAWGFFPTCCGRSSPAAAIIAVISVLSLSCAAPSEQSDSATRGYTLLDEDLDETPGKTQVTMNILVPESATDQELTELLNQLLQDASQRTGFQYHEHPTVVGIYAYASREHAESGMGQWEAMVAKTPPDPEPSVRIRPGRGTAAEPQTVLDLQRRNGWLPIANSSVRRIGVRLKRNVSSRPRTSLTWPISADKSSERTNSRTVTSKALLINWASHATNSMKLPSRDLHRTGQCQPHDAA